jgi:hypothetical protein
MKSKKINFQMINEFTDFDILPKEINKKDTYKLVKIINHLDKSDSKKREIIYPYFITTIVQAFIGVDDELKEIKIYGKNDKGEPYIITIK